MSGVKNRKLCWNCEGSVHIHATKCPYCGTDLTAEAPNAPQAQSQPLPSYDFAPMSTHQEEIPAPPFSAAHSTPDTYSYQSPTHEPQGWREQATDTRPLVGEEYGAKSRAEILPMLLMLPGAFFLLFGLVLLLFSNEGTLTLRWNSGYWFVYLLIAAPLMYFGWRALRKPPVPAPQPVRRDHLPPLYPHDKR